MRKLVSLITLMLYANWSHRKYVFGLWNIVTFCSVVNPRLEDRSVGFHNKVESSAESRVHFVFGSDRFECLEKLLKSEADFGVFLPEDLFLIPLTSVSSSDNLLVTHEFKTRWNRAYRFDSVALRWSTGTGDLPSLKKLSLCHPGSNEHGWLFDFSDVFLQVFANMYVANEPSSCISELTVYENKLRSLNSFFGPSCIPGPWSPSPYVDLILKARYSNLCKLCHDKSNYCSMNDTFWGPEGSLACFTSCTGNILWYQYQYLKRALHDLPPQAKCRPTETLPLVCPVWHRMSTPNQPCTWISRPWPIIVTRNSSSENVAELITRVNGSSVRPNETITWESAFRKILLSSSNDPIHAVWSTSPEKYLNQIQGFVEAKMVPKCNSSKFPIRICVDGHYLLIRCNFMARVAKVYGVDPGIECYFEEKCFLRLFELQYDAVLTYGENIERILRLNVFKIILHQKEDDIFKFRYTYAVVRSGSKLRTLSDLRGVRACFTRRYGLAWNSLLIELFESFLIPSVCRGSQALANFFGGICVANRSDSWIPHCFEEDMNYYTSIRRREESEALRCLAENRGDVAFIDYKWIGKYLDTNKNHTWASGLNAQDFRPLCIRNINSNFPLCYLAKESSRKILVLKNITSRREEEVIFTILIASSFLATKEVNLNMDFRLFKLPKFNRRERLVVYEDGAVDFQTVEEYETSMGKYGSYEAKLQRVLRNCSSDRMPRVKVASFIKIYTIVVLLIVTVVVTMILILKLWPNH